MIESFAVRIIAWAITVLVLLAGSAAIQYAATH